MAFEEEDTGWDWWEETRPNSKKVDRCWSSSAQSRLCGGESEKEFADRLAKAVWKANGKPGQCMEATYLENLPYETCNRGTKAYTRLMDEAAHRAGEEEEEPAK